MVEALIASGVSAFIALVTASVLANGLSVHRTIDKKVELSLMITSVAAALSSNGSCTSALSGQAFDAPHFVVKNPADGSLLASDGAELSPGSGSYSLKLVRVGSVGPDRYHGTLELAAPSFRPKSIHVAFTTLAGQKIIDRCVIEPEMALECVTAGVNGLSNQLGMASNTLGETVNPTDVFTTDAYTSGEDDWGLSCKEGWYNTGCSFSNGSSPVPDRDVRSARNGCFSDNEELAGSSPVVSATCCRVVAK